MTAKLSLVCPGCQKRLQSTRSDIGKRGICKSCRTPFVIDELVHLATDNLFYLIQGVIVLLAMPMGLFVLYVTHKLMHPEESHGGRDVASSIEVMIVATVIGIIPIRHLMEILGFTRGDTSHEESLNSQLYKNGSACLFLGIGSVCLLSLSTVLSHVTKQQINDKAKESAGKIDRIILSRSA